MAERTCFPVYTCALTTLRSIRKEALLLQENSLGGIPDQKSASRRRLMSRGVTSRRVTNSEVMSIGVLILE